jgi:hypothetical protein
MICSNPQCFGKKDTGLSPHDLPFLLIKRKKKFSTNLMLKKNPTKIILEGKNPMRKNIVAIDNIL